MIARGLPTNSSSTSARKSNAVHVAWGGESDEEDGNINAVDDTPPDDTEEVHVDTDEEGEDVMAFEGGPDRASQLVIINPQSRKPEVVSVSCSLSHVNKFILSSCVKRLNLTPIQLREPRTVHVLTLDFELTHMVESNCRSTSAGHPSRR